MVKIIALTKKNITHYLQGIVEVEQDVIATLGKTFSEETWDQQNFLHDLPGKWDNSFVAMIDASVAGYLIASDLTENIVHLNRISVGSQWRGKNMGKSMLLQLHHSVLCHGGNGISLFVNCENDHAISFYESLLYQKLAGEKLKKFLTLKGKESTFNTDRALMSDNNSSFVLYKDLKYQD